MTSPSISRRTFFLHAGSGFGGLAAAAMMAEETGAVAAARHRPARAKRVIQLFMNGGVSQMDTFDPKPRLAQLHGRRFDPGTDDVVESVTNSPGFKVMRSPFTFRQYGQSGRWVSNVFPHLANVVDDLAFLMSMHSPTNVHGLGSYMQNTGFTTPGFPCMGAWISYGLGRLNKNLPEFVVMPDPRGLPYNNLGNFSSGFLPARHQGTILGAASSQPIPYLFPPPKASHITLESERASRDVLRMMNGRYAARASQDTRFQARMEAYELAAALQLSAPEVFDLNEETSATKKLYGLGGETTDDFARRCLYGRRLLERGVRFVQIWSGPGGPTNNWDNHANIETELPYMADQVDKPIAGLIQDLKSRGMLDDTLVIWTTEFGRMPFSQGQAGRDHNGGTFVSWLAGGGVKGGVTYGQSDEWGWKAQKPIWCYDLHATVLHLLGIDHEKLTFLHNGIDRRLTDVHGHVLHDILA